MAAPKGNDYARKWTEDEAKVAFIDGVEYATNNEECLCIQDVILYIEMPSRTFYDLTKQFEVLQSIKEDMHTAIIARVNKGSMHGDYPPAPSIWRQKQLGESDQQNINVTSNGKSLPDWMDEK